MYGDLPYSSLLPIECLAACFNDVTNSYKFYWFLAILENIHKGTDSRIFLNDLIAEMIASVWYPSNYFRLSFGKQDRLGNLALQLATSNNLSMDAPKNKIKETILRNLKANTPIGREIKKLGDYVPYRFLRPFFPELRGLLDSQVNAKIMALSEERFTSPSPCLYRFVRPTQESIELHPDWIDYLKKHFVILREFCLWNLLNYLQRNNPNVPNLASKLFEPQERDLNKARIFWRTALQVLGKIKCIYSGQEVPHSGFSLDHFLPWRFVTHDLIWNIVPTLRSVNAAKSDQIPDLNRYFEGFAHIQYEAFQAVAAQGRETLLEDYVLLFRTSNVGFLRSWLLAEFKEKLFREIAPQVQIARNMGFQTDWRYPA